MRLAGIGSAAALGQSLGNNCWGDFRYGCGPAACLLEAIGFQAETDLESVGTENADARSAVTRRFRVAIATAGRFHVLDLARELGALGFEVDFYSYVPKSRAERFGLPRGCHRSLVPFALPALAVERFAPAVSPVVREWLLYKSLNLAVI